MANYPKRIKKLLNDYVKEAYERELDHELAKLDKSFAEWRNGSISSEELSHRIHQYYLGPSRDLFKRYNDSPPDMCVAYAVVVGILQWDELPGDLLETISAPLSFYQSMKDLQQLQFPDE